MVPKNRYAHCSNTPRKLIEDRHHSPVTLHMALPPVTARPTTRRGRRTDTTGLDLGSILKYKEPISANECHMCTYGLKALQQKGWVGYYMTN